MDSIKESIIQKLKDSFQDDLDVYAFWLEGTDALGKADAYSDIDVWFDVADGKEEDVFNKMENILTGIAPLDLNYKINHDHPQIKQKYYHLQDTSEYLLIDVCIQSHSREQIYFIKGHPHETPKVIFDKAQVIQFKDQDKGELKKVAKERLYHIKNTFVQQARVKKCIERGQFLEAVAYYHRWILQPLTELLRIKYSPLNIDFGLVKVSQDLPREAVRKLENLYKVNSVEEIRSQLERANKWFDEILSDVSEMAD